jgi:hypothetical protein
MHMEGDNHSHDETAQVDPRYTTRNVDDGNVKGILLELGTRPRVLAFTHWFSEMTCWTFKTETEQT